MQLKLIVRTVDDIVVVDCAGVWFLAKSPPTCATP